MFYVLFRLYDFRACIRRHKTPGAIPYSTPMNPFVKIRYDASNAMSKRNLLLAQPPAYFRGVFNGRDPSLQERLACIEQQVLQLLSQEAYYNETYQVMIERASPLIHICIRRHDGRPCKDWSEHQQIKSQLIGPEYEAVELFPAESRLIDTTNEYHLWVHPAPSFRFPFGFDSNRCAIETPLVLGGGSQAA